MLDFGSCARFVHLVCVLSPSQASGEVFDGLRSLGSADLSPFGVEIVSSDPSELIGPAYSGDLGSKSCFS